MQSVGEGRNKLHKRALTRHVKVAQSSPTAEIALLVLDRRRRLGAAADLASSNLTMGLALYLMHSPREALVFVQRSDSMFRSVAVRDPDPLSNGIVHAVALLYLGRIEARLHHPELARKNLDLAKAKLEQFLKRSPKHRYILDAVGETQAALKALPADTASLAVH